MKNRILALALCLILSFGLLTACNESAKNVEDENVLVIYTSANEDQVNVLIPMFEKETGIKVELITAGTGELYKRLESEQENPYADVLWGSSKQQTAGRYDLFEEYVSPNDKYLYENGQNTTGYLTSFNTTGSCLIVNTNLAGDIEINGYADLLNPALKGKIAHADSANSSSAFNHLTNMLLAMGGDYESEEGWGYVAEFIKNLDGKVASGSGNVPKSVADGEYIVGLTYEGLGMSYVNSGAPVKVVYPEEGTVFINAIAGIVKNAKHIENAKKFIDFLISKEAQDAIGTELTNRPLRRDAALGDSMLPLDEINVIEEDETYVIEHKADLAEKYTELFTELQD